MEEELRGGIDFNHNAIYPNLTFLKGFWPYSFRWAPAALDSLTNLWPRFRGGRILFVA